MHTKGPKHQFCLPCAQERKRERYRAWAARDVNREARNRYQRQGRAAHGLKWKLKKYGLTQAQYDRLPKHCAICSTEDELCFDHDHATGKFRGLLCRRCNRMLGQMEDNADWLAAAARYLRKARR